ncbi:CDK5 regulatory subunit-associated protein 2 isoform X4 [Cataglyphis hispanica]|uniref:CDK5 regulatory subunit-associated protein 2 isoform X4 n=1 Tax=Cataglyphis hispanica TaxID=1086592 RepID=UPI00217F2F9F|nr:CDK5 regulatory subunit-associated protein 2 isoform X4 [Cataglyphis hispanica]
MLLGGCRYSTQNQNVPSTKTSSWSPYSPFRNTNNMPLQDITMSQTMPLTNGGNTRAYGENLPEDKTGATMARSGSGGGGSGGGGGGVGYGRTIKEYEDELSSLKKENFQLKLRIYFLEEKNPTRSGISSSDEDIIKTNVELKDELEKLRKELMEKQVLLNQAATAFKLYEEQKASTRDQYQQLLEIEREKVTKLERELAELREGELDASAFYKETFGITPEQALKNAEKLRQMEEMVASLEAEVKQTNVTLEEERYWAEELENERDQFREQLDIQTQLREKEDCDRVRSIEKLREEVKELKEELLKKDSIVQQYKDNLNERDRLLKQKNTLLEEKCRMYEEINQVSEKRKKQIIQLRTSVKTRDDALAEINNKHRALLLQYENYGKRSSPPNSPLAVTSLATAENLSLFVGQNKTKYDGANDRESSTKENSASLNSPLGGDGKEIRQLIKELEERDNELKRQEETRKQLILKLCNAQKQVENSEQKLKKLEGEYDKAIRAIQGFVEREQHLQDIYSRKEQRILELEKEMRKGRNSNDLVSLKDLGIKNIENSQNDPCEQQRFEEMESKINDLRDQIETIKAEKSLLEKRTQVESEELQERLHDKEQRIEILETEKQIITEELKDKIAELDKLKHTEANSVNEVTTTNHYNDTPQRDELLEQLNQQNAEIEEKNRKIEQLTKELQVTTQNLQKLVNTELWSKNKEIAKLHNHMTASYGHDRSRNKSETVQEADNSQLTNLIRELNEIGVKVNFVDETVQLVYINGNETVNVKTLNEYVQRLTNQRNDLEKEVDYLKWLKLVAKPDIAAEIDGDCGNETERAKKYCELLRTHLKDLVKFMKEMLQSADRADTVGNEHKKIVLDVLLNSKILSNDFVRALEGMTVQDDVIVNGRMDGSVKRSRSENIAETTKNQASQSDSETFSEPDRTVSMARIGLQEMQYKNPSRSRFTKYTKTCSDSEDSADYTVPYYKTYQNDLNDLDTSCQIQELKETNNMLYSELSALRNDLVTKVSFDCTIDEKLTLFITKLEKSQRFCEKLQASLEKRIHEFHVLRKENKQNSFRKTQMEKKINDVEQMASEMTKQKAEFLQYKENERKTMETLLTLNKENESMRVGIKRLEEENETAKTTISTLRKDLDHLTLSHSQILVENTKLTNDKLRLEQEIRKMENRYDVNVRSLHDKFSKENLQYWQSTNYYTLGGRSKSSCSPDLGIESDAAVTTIRPLKDTLKITESMTNLLSDEDSGNGNHRARDTNSESPLPIEGLDEVETLKQENEALKRRLMKTRRALEDTFEHLSASNKNKKNVEKAIIKQLMVTRNVLKKTRTFNEPSDN